MRFRSLLVPVVVGLVLLGLLFFSRLLICCFTPEDFTPTQHAMGAVKNLLNSIGELKVTDMVRFSVGESLNARTIAIETRQLAEDQVCVSPGDFAGDKNFNVVEDGKVIEYQGEPGRAARLAVLCDYGSRLGDTLKAYGRDPGWAAQCGCAREEDRCCLVALARNA